MILAKQEIDDDTTIYITKLIRFCIDRITCGAYNFQLIWLQFGFSAAFHQIILNRMRIFR